MRRLTTILLLLVVNIPVIATDTGPNYSGTGGVSGTGTAWSNVTNAVGSTADNYATVSLTTNGETAEYIELTNFSFAIPDGDQINGITVEIRWRQSATKIQESNIEIIKGGTIAGDNKSTGSALPATATVSSFGGSTDLWGLSWSESDIEASNFGVAIKVTKQGGGGAESGEIDWVRITVSSSTASSGSGADSDRQVSAGGSDDSWTPLTNQLASSNDVYESVTMATNGNNSQYLIVDNFGLTVDSGHEVNGISVSIERSASGTGVTDFHIYLVDETGAVVTGGDDKAAGGDWPTTDATVSYGSAADLWGQAAGFWTPAKVNDVDFGVAIAVQRGGGGGSRVANVDFVTLTVSSSPPLPVDLLDFSGSHEYGKNVLKWTTVSELNNDYFEIESASVDLAFQVIGEMDGNGTTNETHHYSFIDESPRSSKTYYRIKQVDYDGAFEYFPIIRVDSEHSENGIVTYPNPSKGRVQILHNDFAILAIRLFDSSGREYDVKKLNQHELDISDIPSGVYQLIFETPTATISKRMIKN